MSGYLANVIAQARGAPSQIRPRPRSRFETERGDETPPTELDGEAIAASPSAVSPNPTPGPAQPRTTAPAGAIPSHEPGQERPIATAPSHNSATVSVTNPPAPVSIPPQPAPGTPPREQAIHRIERTERVERIERTAIVAPPPAPDTRISAPPPVSAEPREPPRAPGVQVVVQPLPHPVPAPPPAAAPITAPNAASPATRRADPAPTAPEITISIGVLDIRLTRDAEPPRRPATSPPATTEPPLPLADYLARRSGTAP